MDPVARRHLWNAITKIRDAGTSIVLTSHSMEECEALFTRLSIMVNGKFRCLGPPQHLKNKFGEGYTLIAQTAVKEGPSITRASMEGSRRRSSAHANAAPWEKQLNPLRNYIENVFPGAQLKDLHPGYLQYHIAATAQVTWADLFRKMETAKEQFGLEAYSVGQTTLEQVFLNFTKAQVESDD
jgi:ATP-binding cassette subfamily A (ABC1) protein 3